MKDNLLTPEQVAELLQLHILTVYSYIRQGKLEAVRLGRAYRIVPQDLELFIESNRTRMPCSPFKQEAEVSLARGGR